MARLSERLYKWFSDLTGVKLKFNSAIYIIIVIHPSIHIDDDNEDADVDDFSAHVIKATLIIQAQAQAQALALAQAQDRPHSQPLEPDSEPLYLCLYSYLWLFVLVATKLSDLST